MADVARPKQSPEDSIEIVHSCGGVVFVAHAVFIGADYPDVVRALAGWGLDGIETYYKHYDADTIAILESLPLAKGDMELICHKNAERILKVKPQG